MGATIPKGPALPGAWCALLLAAAPLVLAGCEDDDDDPDVPVVTALDPRSHEPFFPIASGPHEGLDCNACHGKFDTFRRFECLDCHKHQKDATDAIHAAEPDYLYESTSCLSCHPRGVADGAPSDHDRRFPIGPGTAHAGTACSSCHASSADRSLVTCSSASCHPAAQVEPPHADVGGFAVDSKLCERCHADAQVDDVATHGPLLVSPGAPHHMAECLTCHPGVRADKAFGADFGTRDCLGCHEHEKNLTDGLHQGIDGYAYGTASCLTCHPDGTRDAVYVHPYFPTDAGSKHEDVACGTCHRAPDRRDVTCSDATCHDSAVIPQIHAGVGGFAVDACKRCHADAQVDRIAAHEPFAIEVGAPHHEQSCLTCHPQLRADRPSGADFAVNTCVDAGCHPQAATTTQHQGRPGYEYATGSCRLCHPTGSAADAVDHADRYPIGPGTAHDVECGGCHTDPDDGKVVTCAGSCHTQAAMSTTHVNRVGGYQYQTALCLRCHPDTPAFPLAAHLPFVITAAGRHSSCLTCHPSMRSDRPYPAARFDVYDCLGSGCHSNRTDLDDEHADEPGYRYESTACTQSGCHPDGRKR